MNKKTTVTIINDCRDTNAVGRQQTRLASILNCCSSFIGVNNDLEAAGNLIDSLDALGKSSGIILANIAPRGGKAKKWKNGSPFAWFKYKNTLVVSTIDGLTLSLVKKLKLTNQINILDTEIVLGKLVNSNKISKKQRNHISRSQFRSYDFVPHIVEFLQSEESKLSKKVPIDKLPDAPKAIWWIDCFGNCKTTLLPEEITDKANSIIQTRLGKIKHYPRLRDVPNGRTALITGSSGIESNRFVELIIQGGSAAKKYQLSTGDTIFKTQT
ncbi:SAM-dependent chlorinase/fluorinase [Candidatus Microgenomates bacterium]|nr:SAM-dependent chlorinase/fluorinase [Candidatus Microgenomates bacterium]